MRHAVTAMVLIIAAFVLPPADVAHAAKRVALVIGNDNYENLPKLQRAGNDARAVAKTLKTIGFEVYSGIDLTRRETNRKISEFEAAIAPGDMAFFFFAGHGVSIGGENFLIPRDMPKTKSGESGLVRDESHAATALVRRIRERGARSTIVILDACRDNPFAAQGTRSIGATRGLARTHAPGGVFILFSAGLGQTALDRLSESDTDPNSVFTRKLLGLLATPGLSQVDMAKQIQRDVSALARTVGHVQEPAYYDQIIGELVLSEPRVEDPVKIARKTPTNELTEQTKPANSRDADTLFRRGWAFESGEGAPQDYAEAARLYRQAVALGHVRAANNLGNLHLEGRGVSKDTKRALKLFRQAAAGADSYAYYNLGRMLELGIEVKRDLRKAREFYQKSADQNNRGGQNNLGRMYALGLGTRKNLKKAASLYRLSAEQGFAIAQNNLAIFYLSGQGVAKDYKQARKWFKAAADQGHATSQSNLGWMYRMGWGVKKNYAAALRLIRKSAAQGDKFGQNNLGVMYERGLGVRRSVRTARKYYRLAARQGHARAKRNLRRLKK